MPYRHRAPVSRVAEIDDDDGYIGAPTNNRSSLLLFLLLLLVVGWFLFRQGGFSSFGASWGSRPVAWSTSDQPVSVERPIIREQPVVEVPRVTRPVVEVPRVTRPVVTITPRPRVKEKGGFKPSTAFPRDSNVIAYAWVVADEVRIRKGPGAEYDAFYLLPQNWPVAILSGSDVDNNGEAWTHVRFETNQGFKQGWLSRKYLSY